MSEIWFPGLHDIGTGKTNRCEYLAHKIQKLTEVAD